jgi:hypothetical protein
MGRQPSHCFVTFAFFVVKIRFFSADFTSVLEEEDRFLDNARPLEEFFFVYLSIDYLFTVGFGEFR